MKLKAFTLAELLIALAILGVIATFTIPKVLTTNQNAQKNAMAKEVIASVSGAYEAYKSENGVSATTKLKNITPYMNYIRVDTTSTIDADEGLTSYTCSSTAPCLKLHNGSIIKFFDDCFGNSTNTNMIWYSYDPDGQYSGSTTGPGKGIGMAFYYNGRQTTVDGLSNPSQTDYSCNGSLNPETPASGYIPSWFSWN
ncbi:MAG: type II secretion system protein [Vampirovibrionales bacterium]|nr:type II secretion system protein [Vampirovibrionales bacterium]